MSDPRVNDPMDPDLNDVLGDPELIRIARLLSKTKTAEPPLDDAFKSALRRQLMAEAWRKTEGGAGADWWRRLLAPQRIAWVGATAVVLIAASVVFWTATTPSGGFTQTIDVNSPVQDANGVPVHQAILVAFNQPMDHASTEAAVQITPATTVAFRWGGDTNLYVQPTSGDLAPSTQYQITIGPGAKTLAGTKLDTPKTVTFVTQPTTTPSPPPSPSPKPNALNQAELTTAYPPAGTTYPPVWSADSKTVYFVGGGGALEAVSAAGGAGNQAKTLVADGVSLLAIAPAGDRLAYVHGGNIEVLTIATGAISDVAVTPVPTTVTWVKDKVEWGSSDGIFTIGDGGPVRIATNPAPDGTAVSIAPDGGHAVFAEADTLLIVDIAAGKSAPLCAGGCATAFQGWSPDGTRVVYGGVISTPTGRKVASLPGAAISWSAANVILLGSDTGLYEIRPDGSGLTKLADGTFDNPVWAPDSSTFTFVRGGLWVATAPPAAPLPAATDQALAVVNAFMQARLDGNSDRASLYLDDAAKAVYNSGTPALIPSGTPVFKRFYVLTSEVDPSSPNTVRVVVRLVFADGKVEKSAVEETLSLKRDQATDPFLIDGVSASQPRDLGKGPEVVAVKVTPSEVDVTFDSDLTPTTIGGVTLQDANGMALTATQALTDRTVALTGLQLSPGAHYRLVVMPTVLDVGGRHIAAEYDLDLVGPAPTQTAGGVNPTPSPAPVSSPSPSASPSPAASSTPTATAA